MEQTLAELNVKFPLHPHPENKFVEDSLDFLEYLFEPYPQPNFQVRLWEGNVWGSRIGYRFALALKHPGALRKMFQSPSELALGEAYILDDFDIEGNLEESFALAEFLLSQERSLTQKLRLAALLRKLPATGRPHVVPSQLYLPGIRHSCRRDQAAVRYHYDLPPEFFALFLDRQLVYSCGYFHTPEEDLDQAQENKLDYICQKLRLRPGERFLDIGCGWGALVMHASSRYGVESLGITLSEKQAEFAQRRIRETHVDHCQVGMSDYRELDTSAPFDKIASVGMFEHVGEAMLPTYFRRVCDLLKPGGVFLNHGIARSATYVRMGPSFTDAYVFPDGELAPIHTTVRAAEQSMLEVRDVENLREHYVMTLRHWVDRLQKNADLARRITDETTYRIWRLYMAGSAYAFRTGRLALYQTLLVKPRFGESGFPLTRQDWYTKL